MQRFARLVDGVVAEIIELPLVSRDLILDEDGTAQLGEDGEFQYSERPFRLEDVFPPSIAEQMRPCGPEVEQGWLFDGEAFTRPPELPTLPPVQPGPIAIPVAVFFGRTTDEEAEAIDAAMRGKPVRIRSIWAGVADQGRDLHEDAVLWPALRAEIVKLYDEARADALLARPN